MSDLCVTLASMWQVHPGKEWFARSLGFFSSSDMFKSSLQGVKSLRTCCAPAIGWIVNMFPNQQCWDRDQKIGFPIPVTDSPFPEECKHNLPTDKTDIDIGQRLVDRRTHRLRRTVPCFWSSPQWLGLFPCSLGQTAKWDKWKIWLGALF